MSFREAVFGGDVQGRRTRREWVLRYVAHHIGQVPRHSGRSRERITDNGYLRFRCKDPFGNRLEVLAADSDPADIRRIIVRLPTGDLRQQAVRPSTVV